MDHDEKLCHYVVIKYLLLNVFLYKSCSSKDDTFFFIKIKKKKKKGNTVISSKVLNQNFKEGWQKV